ncbi:MAG: TDP-N-acetylfucosamine:lipid II N-acetylfucosaminyltransferase [bacterium]
MVHDEKFIDGLIRRCERVLPGEHTYALESNTGADSVKQIRNVSKLSFVESFSRLQWSVFEGGYPRAIICHFLSAQKAAYLLGMSGSSNIMWAEWGADLYPFCVEPATLFLADTYKEYVRTRSRKEIIIEHLRPRLYKYAPRLTKARQLYSRIDFVAPVVPEEWGFITTLPGMRAKRVRFNYGGLSDCVGQGIDRVATGSNVLVGNSCSITSNHIDVFRMLADVDLSGRKVIVPLSYGGDGGGYYKALVVDKGKYYLGNKFIPLVEFTPLEQYLDIMQSCQHAIYCHVRQQAVGNVLASIWMGASLYLHENSPVYRHLKALGIVINAICPARGIQLTSPPDLNKQRSLLLREYADDIVDARVKYCLEEIAAPRI